MKGFHKQWRLFGESLWLNFGKEARQDWNGNSTAGKITAPLASLGAYYRVDGKYIVDMQSAIFETYGD